MERKQKHWKPLNFTKTKKIVKGILERAKQVYTAASKCILWTEILLLSDEKKQRKSNQESKLSFSY